MKDETTSSATQHRPTLRVLDVLESLASAEYGLSLTEIAARISASKSTLFPIIKSLVDRRYIHFDHISLRYSLDVACWMLAGASTERNVWLRMINEEMQRVVEACDEVCQLGVLDGDNVLYIGKVQSQQTVRLISHIGKRIPATTTALGKALICRFDLDRLKALYPNGLPVITRYSVQDFDELRRRLDMVLEHGYAMDQQESSEETQCYAIPLRQRDRTVAALSVSVPVFRATEEKQQKILAALFSAQERIERLFRASKEIELIDS